MDFAPRDADPSGTTLAVNAISYIAQRSPLLTDRLVQSGQTNPENKKMGLTARSPCPVVTGLIQASHFGSQQQRRGETPGLIFFLYERLTCVCKVLYLTKGKGNRHLERGIVLCLYPSG